MKRDEFLQKLGQVNLWRTRGQRAPHKPLLVLLALARVVRGEERLARYEQDIERPLTDLLERFGPPRKAIHRTGMPSLSTNRISTALDEDDVVAGVTRRLLEEHPLLRNKVYTGLKNSIKPDDHTNLSRIQPLLNTAGQTSSKLTTSPLMTSWFRRHNRGRI